MDSGRRSSMDWHRVRRGVAHVLEAGIGHERLATIVHLCIIALLVGSVAAFVASTVPHVRQTYGHHLAAFEKLCVVCFAIEYAARIWSAIELPQMHGRAPWKARLQHAAQPMQIVDLLAFLPAVIEMLLPIDLDALRVLRLLRLARVVRYSTALQSLSCVLSQERSALFGALLIMLILVVIAGTGMHYVERAAQPKAFGTIPDAMWWAIVTLSTVGYGDVVPVTGLGKVFSGITIIVGMCVFALPIGIIATGFAQELQRRNFVITWALVSRVPLFAGLDAASAAQVMTLLKSETYDEGDAIVHKGDAGTSMYFIATGRVAVELEDGDVTLEEGDFFGELALFENRPRTHTVVAIANRTRCLVLDRDDLERLGRRMPAILARIREVAAARSLRNAKPA